MSSKYNNNSHCLLLCFRYIAFYFLVAFLPLSAMGVAQCPHQKDSLFAEMRSIACATQDLQIAVRKNDLLKKIANINFFSINNDPRDVVRGVEVLSSTSYALKDRITNFHENQLDSGRNAYTISITTYPAKVKKDSCGKEYKTIDVNTGSMNYRAIEGKIPRSFGVRYNPNKKEFFMCENTDLSRSKREETYCINIQSCKSACINANNRAACNEDCDKTFTDCKQALLVSCLHADNQGSVTTDKAKACLSFDDYNNLSKKLFLGSGFFSFSNPALEQNCPDGCSYYTHTLQRVFVKNKKACSDNYVIVHCGPQKDSSDYNLNIREVKNLCTDFNSSGCSVF